MSDKINIAEKHSLIKELWSPRVIAEMNDYQFKLAKIKDEFIWHTHEETDEVFMVFKGSMFMSYRDKTIQLSEGEMCVVPKGVEHKPYAEEECSIMLIEPKGTINTGDTDSDRRIDNDIWI